MAWFLQSIGINVLSKEKKLQDLTSSFLAFHFALIFTTAGIIMYAIMNRKHFEEAIIIAAFLGSMIIIDIAIPILFQNRYKLKELLFRMDENIFVYPDEDEIHVDYELTMQENYTRKLIILVFCYVCFGFSLSGVSPFIGLYLTGKFKTVIYPAWYPWKEDNFAKASITYCIQLITSTCVFWSYFLFQIFAILVVIEFERQYKRLCTALCLVNERTKRMFVKKMFNDGAKVDWDSLNYMNYKHSNFNRNQKVVFNDIYRQKITYCISHHQQLLRSFNLFKSWYTGLFSVELATSVVTFGLVFYNVLQMTNYERCFTIIGSSFNVMTNLFSRCLIGEIFSEMNEKVTNTIIHDVNWYDQTLANQKLLLILHVLTKRQYKIFAFKLFEASYYTFAGITRASYSYFNIIRRQ
ncbi:uncharacterized protein LOC135840588 [Planococcus citri]|uniref:uncharacterized protein LOC135840588 n=1 Tax=Planococcus citri TaxID=170843 RepID=UPI0031F78FBC